VESRAAASAASLLAAAVGSKLGATEEDLSVVETDWASRPLDTRRTPADDDDVDLLPMVRAIDLDM